MAKLMTMMMITIGIIVLLNMAGLPTFSSRILDEWGLDIFNIQQFSTGAFYAALAAALIVLALVGSGIKVGFFGSGISAGFTTVSQSALIASPLLLLISDIFSIIMITKSGDTFGWVSYLLFPFIIIYGIGYGIALLDWVKGQDS